MSNHILLNPIVSFWLLLIRFNDFGTDGGPAAKELAPKLHLTKAHLSSRLGVALPDIEVLPWSSYIFYAVYINVRSINWRMIFFEKRWNKWYGQLLVWKDLEAYSLLLATSLVPIFWLGLTSFLFINIIQSLA